MFANGDINHFDTMRAAAKTAKLNHRPRRVLDWATPAEVLTDVLSRPVASATAYPVEVWLRS